MENIILVQASGTTIDKIINEYIEQNKINSIDNSSINDIIDEITDKLNIDVTKDNATKSILSSRAKTKVILMNEKIRKKDPNKEIKFTNNDVTNFVQESIAETRVDKKFVKVSKELFKLDKNIKDYEKKAKTRYRGANKFLQNL